MENLGKEQLEWVCPNEMTEVETVYFCKLLHRFNQKYNNNEFGD